MYSGHKINGNQIHITFNNIGQGLMVGRKDKLNPTVEIKNGTLSIFL